MATKINNSPERTAYLAGWDASRRTKTFDLDAAEARFEAKHGAGFGGSMFAAGWVDFAAEYAKWTSFAEAESAPEQPEKAPAKAKATKPAKTAQAALPAPTLATGKGEHVRQYRHIHAKALASSGAAVLAASGLKVVTTVTGYWAEAQLRMSGTDAQLAKAHKLLDAVEAEALTAMLAHHAADAERRKALTGYQRRIDSRRFLEAYVLTVAARLAGKTPKGTKADEPGTRAGRAAAKSATLPSA